MVARASSLMALDAPLTLRSSGSLRVMRQRATASSLEAGSALSVRTTRGRDAGDLVRGRRCDDAQKAASTSSALASMSSPVRATLRSVRNPPSSFIATLSVAGGGSPFVPRHPHAVRCHLLELHGVEAGGDVGAEVGGRADLVEQLRGDRADGDRAARALVHADHAGAVGRDLGPREPGVREAGRAR